MDRSGLRWTRRRIALASLPLIVLAAAYVIATVDIRGHDGRVSRSVELAGIDVGGMTPDELEQSLDRINSFITTAPVYIETPEAAYEIGADRLGLQIDRGATRAAVLAAGRQGNSATRPLTWLGALFAPREVDAVLRLDPAAAEAGLAAVSKTISIEPGDPSLVVRNGRLELLPGTAGSILDVTRLLRDLSTSLPTEPGAAINVSAFTTDDSVIDVEIQALIDRLNGSSTRPLQFLVGDQTLSMPSIEFRQMIELDLAGPQPKAQISSSKLFAWLNGAAGIAEGRIDTTALVVEGSQIRLPGSNATLCCSAETPDRVLEAVLAGTPVIRVDLLNDNLTPLVELGIAEMMGEFTTQHPSGQDRVINIQRMADIVRGAIIEPGATFSLNGFVGERTQARGFVPAGVIYDGVFAEDVGGGVSQFATTLFNAAFFAGLDIDRYQMHSIYIDRYPYGREATVNWPSVDLQITNPTDWPVLIWTEYTPSSITVKMFGTALVSGEMTNQTTEPIDECTRVRTERTRTWFDGRVDVDGFTATYQPAEGLGCDGQPTAPPPECDDDQAPVDTTDNGFADDCALITDICPEGTVPIDEDGDQIVDFCNTRDCPPETTPTDLDGDGEIDVCALAEPEPSPTPEATPTNAAEPTQAAQATATAEALAQGDGDG